LTVPGKRAKVVFSDQYGRRIDYSLDVDKSIRHPDLLTNKWFSVPDPQPVTVFPPFGIISGVKSCFHPLDRDNRDIRWQLRVQRPFDRLVRKIWTSVWNACDLTSRVHAPVSASGERNPRLLIEKSREGPLELLLNSSLTRLHL
jgi:hypothetical protein